MVVQEKKENQEEDVNPRNQEKVKKIGTFGPFAVLQDRQNMGIGTKLLNEIEKKVQILSKSDHLENFEPDD